jgi:hypothetical protein
MRGAIADFAPAPASADPWAPDSADDRRARGGRDGTPAPTELIFNLYNRGDGWGEEIVPHVTVERRVVKGRRRKRNQRWEVRRCTLIQPEHCTKIIVCNLAPCCKGDCRRGRVRPAWRTATCPGFKATKTRAGTTGCNRAAVQVAVHSERPI